MQSLNGLGPSEVRQPHVRGLVAVPRSSRNDAPIHQSAVAAAHLIQRLQAILTQLQAQPQLPRPSWTRLPCHGTAALRIRLGTQSNTGALCCTTAGLPSWDCWCTIT